jgi:putative endonuclease
LSKPITESSTQDPKEIKADVPYTLYLLECEGGSWYAGIARDAEDRFIKHLTRKGAAYTRANPPIRILRSMDLDNKSQALKAEIALKKLPKSKKLGFFDHAFVPAQPPAKQKKDKRPPKVAVACKIL